jgi:hypothetical protein
MNFIINDFEPLDERLIVRPGKAYKIPGTYTVPDEKKNKNKKPMDLHDVKKVTEMVRTSLRVGTVIAGTIGRYNEVTTKFEPYITPGMRVAYFEKGAIPFDLLAKEDNDPDCPVLVKRYDVVALYSGDIEEEVKEINIEDNGGK